MKLLNYGSKAWGEGKSWWLIIGKDLGFQRDLFRVEIDKTVRSHFFIGAQIGGDCLFELDLSFGKYCGEIRIWGY